ncbi:RimK family alpha-L-glutamate ligase [Kribbella sp. NPDC051586]|uniref:RimK family alpha-L-glutamate ligase n=1 Tax=Kribbella sp. NPDC051586 TaxID=3364118 RepID=UPI0037974CD8
MTARDDVWFLDRFSQSWENLALCAALAERGLRGRIVDWDDLAMSGGLAGAVRDGQPVAAPRVAVVKSRVITRRSAGDLALIYDELEALEEAGTRISNPVAAIRRCRNKLRQAALLARAGLPVPETRSVSSQDDIQACMKDWGEVVLKPIWGHASLDVVRMRPGGRGIEEGTVLGIREEIASWHLLEHHKTLCAQPFVPNPARDLRVVVIGSTIAAADYHVSTSPDGAVRHFLYPLKVERAPISPGLEEIVLGAVVALGLDSAVIDLVESPSGPVIIEVNEGLTVWRTVEGTEHDRTPHGFTALVTDQLEALAATTASSSVPAPKRIGSETGRPDAVSMRSTS